MKRENSFPDLVAYLDEVERTPYQVGQHDCALFVAGAIAVQTGTDLAADYRGKYSTVEQGYRLFKKATGSADYISSLNDVLRPIDAHQVQSGDIGMIDAGNDQKALGVVCGPNIYVVTEGGLGIRPITEIILAWEV